MLDSFIILTELGKGIGLGHYTRCIALLKCFNENGQSGKLMTNQVDDTFNYPFSVNYNWTNNQQFIKFYSPDVKIIIDSYLFDSNVLKIFTDYFNNIVIIDDFNRMSYESVKLLINPNVYFSEINYNNQNSNKLGGIDYVILRETFRNVSKYKISNNKKLNILVTIGGSDYRNIMPLIIETLLINSFHNIVAISPDNTISGFLDDRLTILKMQNEHEVYEQMLNCDIAISACGQTLHELSSIGVPTIGICIDSDQTLNQQFYFKSKFLPNLINWHDLNLKEKILDGLQILNNIDRRNQVKNDSPRIINKNGVYNIINIVNEL